MVFAEDFAGVEVGHGDGGFVGDGEDAFAGVTAADAEVVHAGGSADADVPVAVDAVVAELVLVGQACVGRVVADGGLEPYHPLWEDAAEGDELIPTRGCSVPTFHGSAADLAAVAATLVNMIGLHLQQAGAPVSGTHLIALPHAPAGPRHQFLPAGIGASE